MDHHLKEFKKKERKMDANNIPLLSINISRMSIINNLLYVIVA